MNSSRLHPFAGILVLSLLCATALASCGSSSNAVIQLVKSPAPIRLTQLTPDLVRASAQTQIQKLTVPLSHLSGDLPLGFGGESCITNPHASSALGSRTAACVFGDVHSKRTLELVGDSNAWMWLPTFNAIGIAEHFRVDLDSRGACEVADLPMWDTTDHSPGTGCSQFRKYFIAKISRVRPFATVLVDYEYVTKSNYQNQPFTTDAYDAGITSTISRISHDGSSTVLLGTPPPQLFGGPLCLAASASTVKHCGIPAACATIATDIASNCKFSEPGKTYAYLPGLSTAATSGGGHFVPIESLFCTTSICPAVVDDTAVFADDVHVSEHYATLIWPAMAQILARYGIS